nr:MAG TPA: hypothetical protein [Caudoviricetes sp.]
MLLDWLAVVLLFAAFFFFVVSPSEEAAYHFSKVKHWYLAPFGY